MEKDDMENEEQFTTLQGQYVENMDNAYADVNGASIVNVVECANGNIWFLNKVLKTRLTIVELAAKDAELKELVKALGRFDSLKAMLHDDKGPFTVFAPNDKAFRYVSNAGLSDEDLEKVLKYHILDTELLSDDFKSGGDYETMYAGDDGAETIELSLSPTTVNDRARVTKTDAEGLNGVIHVIDAVLQPFPLQTLMEIVAVDQDLRELFAAVKKAGLQDALRADGDKTLFAPNDAAMEAADWRDLDKEALEELLLNHVVAKKILADDIVVDDGFRSRINETIAVTKKKGVVLVGGAKIQESDAVATNGILHIIEAAILPPGRPSGAPTPVPSPAPSNTPRPSESFAPTYSLAPTSRPTPTHEPTYVPTRLPTSAPTSELVIGVNETLFLIEAAGNTEDDKRRFGLLKNLRERLLNDRDTEANGTYYKILGRDIDDLLPYVERWADPTDAFSNFDSRRAETTNAVSGPAGFLAGDKVDLVWPSAFADAIDVAAYPREPESDELYAIWAIYRARWLIWSGIQVNWVDELFYAEGRDLMAAAREAFPDNAILGMYLGTPIEWEDDHKYDSKAPPWANAMHTVLHKLQDVAHWWIDKRQQKDGTFGGGFADDATLWRWWVPLYVAFDEGRPEEVGKKKPKKNVHEAWEVFVENWYKETASFTWGPFPWPYWEDDVSRQSPMLTETMLPMLLREAARPYNAVSKTKYS